MNINLFFLNYFFIIISFISHIFVYIFFNILILYCFFLLIFLGPRAVVNGVYQIIFGVLMIICEARWQKVLKHFKFLTHFLGLGLFYIFVGGLALGGEWYQIAVAIGLLSVGLIYVLLGICCRSMSQEGFGDGTAAGHGNDASKKPADDEPQAIKDMREKAAKKAVDHVVENTNPFA
jgi:hypothetical protein